jgi:uncharacterized membrane protein YcaP (DUF421 family)
MSLCEVPMRLLCVIPKLFVVLVVRTKTTIRNSTTTYMIMMIPLACAGGVANEFKQGPN